MQFFVTKTSVVRKIWSEDDIILLIFAGSAAEFALNKAVDWLYFTGKLPSDPLGRLSSTVKYARRIVFSPLNEAHQTIDAMRSAHQVVEESRNSSIPDWAYRDVLYMLIHYSIAAYELLERKLRKEEKEEVYNVFRRVGERMGVKELPRTYDEWLPDRKEHLSKDLRNSDYTIDLFKQYRKHLGPIRFSVLIEGQKIVTPREVKELLGFNSFSWLSPAVPLYKLCKRLKIDGLIRKTLLPSEYKGQLVISKSVVSN